MPATRSETLPESALPVRVRAAILSGKGEWTFRARRVRCCFEFAEVRAATPGEALWRACDLPPRERTRRFITGGERPHALEVLFDGKWHDIDPYATPGDDERALRAAIADIRARGAGPRPMGDLP
jgi:hypothetical protein